PEKSVFNSWDSTSYKYVDFSKLIENGPIDRGFDYFYGMAGSNNMQPYVLIENNLVTQPPSEEQKAYDHYINVPKAPNWDIRMVNKVFTEKAVDVINEHFNKKSNDPLFLYFPTSAPHRPCLPTFTKGQSEAGLRGDVIEELDWSVAEVVKALKDNGEFENTLLIFTSDNGPRPGDPLLWLENYEQGNYDDWVPEQAYSCEPEFVNEEGNKIWKEGWITYGHKASGDLLGFKSDAWEGGFRVPLVVSWPDRIKEYYKNNNLVCLSDLYSTIADVIGKSPSDKEGVDSYSFLSNLLNKDSGQVRKSLVLSTGASGAFVAIKDNWKYIEAAREGRWPETFYPEGPSNLESQLYNLNYDMFEKNNVYSKFPERIYEFKTLIQDVKNETKTESLLSTK
ncbi:MAG TPA: sulfatase-like hydrolase/transferase, partial [Bacteroidales bacterium]|nr:sulfatase-like hydrolase/transferase [Bacteroidales bacterium]